VAGLVSQAADGPVIGGWKAETGLGTRDSLDNQSRSRCWIGGCLRFSLHPHHHSLSASPAALHQPWRRQGTLWATVL